MDNLEMIEDYFTGNMPDANKEAFEARCVSDTVFAEEVAGYITMRDSLRQHLFDQKKIEFDELYQELSNAPEPTPSAVPVKRRDQLKIARLAFYLAAASILLVVGYALFFRPPLASRLSDEYINANFDTLGQQMGGTDSSSQMQQGIAAYNAKDYSAAEQIFGKTARQPVPQPEVIKNLGITFLATGKYDQAVVAFNALAGFKLYSNPGLFYKAIALMKRNKADDPAQAKKILQEVVRKDLEGSAAAEVWLQKL